MYRKITLTLAALALVLTTGSVSMAGFGMPKVSMPKVKVKSLGSYQQQALAKGFGGAVGYGAGVVATPFVGPYGGAAVGAGVSHGVGNHASKKWTGKGLQNWNKPSRW